MFSSESLGYSFCLGNCTIMAKIQKLNHTYIGETGRTEYRCDPRAQRRGSCGAVRGEANPVPASSRRPAPRPPRAASAGGQNSPWGSCSRSQNLPPGQAPCPFVHKWLSFSGIYNPLKYLETVKFILWGTPVSSNPKGLAYITQPLNRTSISLWLSYSKTIAFSSLLPHCPLKQ